MQIRVGYLHHCSADVTAQMRAKIWRRWMAQHVLAHAPTMQQTLVYHLQDLEPNLTRQHVGVSAPHQRKQRVVKTSV